MDMVEKDWRILCWRAKWLGKRGIIGASLPDYELYEADTEDDYHVLYDLHPLLNEADVVVAHNAARFDVPKVNARMLAHRLRPPSPYRIVDTLRMARSHFSFYSYKLNDLAVALGLGKKLPTGGFGLWRACLEGQPEAWAKMGRYCEQDVRLLEKVFLRLRPYVSRLPNPGTYTGEFCCSKCGSNDVQRRGYAHTNLTKFQRYVCRKCGGWSRARVREGKSAPLSGIV